ncbi:MAG: 4Fe-4S binding protein [Candidatus Methanoperedens sp.]|nr:4Fe-4S binding protein [Candidatus Methanoperedens sp.]MCZ7361014.1 4Fe-4S binding protein [Candidatus Methanoperedens sp.]HLB72289.1 4Fe-4S binding protein [Candidatus Methanoperedens sp.]
MKVDKACVGCGQCAAFCPYGAIIVFGRASMNESCEECGTCIDYCPICAIQEDG